MDLSYDSITLKGIRENNRSPNGRRRNRGQSVSPENRTSFVICSRSGGCVSTHLKSFRGKQPEQRGEGRAIVHAVVAAKQEF